MNVSHLKNYTRKQLTYVKHKENDIQRNTHYAKISDKIQKANMNYYHYNKQLQLQLLTIEQLKPLVICFIYLGFILLLTFVMFVCEILHAFN